MRLAPRAGVLTRIPGQDPRGHIVPATAFLGEDGVAPAPAADVTYVTLLFDQQIVFAAEGLEIASFHPIYLRRSTPLTDTDAQVFAALLGAWPTLEHGLDLYGPEVRPRALFAG